MTDVYKGTKRSSGIENQLQWIIWTRQVWVGDDYDKEDDNDDEKKKQMTATDDKDEIEGVVDDSDLS